MIPEANWGIKINKVNYVNCITFRTLRHKIITSLKILAEALVLIVLGFQFASCFSDIGAYTSSAGRKSNAGSK